MGRLRAAKSFDKTRTEVLLLVASKCHFFQTLLYQVHSYPEVYIIGVAACLEVDGVALPMRAPEAVQMVDTALTNIERELRNLDVQSFCSWNQGRFVTTGRNAAAAEVGASASMGS